MNCKPEPFFNDSISNSAQQLTRRALLRNGALFLLAAGGVSSTSLAGDESSAPLLRIGLVTDLHYADQPPRGTRFYRESLAKLRECVNRFNTVPPDFVVELGDLVDEGETVDEEIGFVKVMEKELARLKGERHYVLGNHCVKNLTKQQFRDNCAARAEHYSFDKGDNHFIVLDACYRADGVAYGQRNFKWNDTEIPPAERKWLKADLQATRKKTIVFAHQRLDVQNHYGVKSAPAVRQILEDSGKVLAVFQGHSHQNDYNEIHGIHYCTLAAMVEGSGEKNNAYGMLSLFQDGSLKLDGFRQQKTYQFAARV